MLQDGLRRTALAACAAMVWAGWLAPVPDPDLPASLPGSFLSPLRLPQVALAHARAQVAASTGAVVHVSDGDTVVVRFGDRDERVRLLGIDAPERSQVPWGPRAASFLRKLVDGKTVRVETDVQTRDRYGRMLGYLFASGTFVNRELVRQGYAMLYTSPPNVSHAEEFLAAQREAREAGRNIWSPTDGLTETPYEYRHNKPAPRSIGQEGLPNHRREDLPNHRQEGLPNHRREDGRGIAQPEERRSGPTSGEEVSGPAGAADQAAATSPIIGNRRSRKFHAATCPLAGTIAPANRVGYASAAEARAAGMAPCHSCGGQAR